MAISKRQIEMLLSNILASPVFAGGAQLKRSARLSDLLDFIVQRYLAEKPVTEMILLLDFWEIDPADIGADKATARKAMARLRKKLEDYSQTYGIDDAIALTIPIGQYLPDFSIKDRSPVKKQIALGFHHVDRESPEHLVQAHAHFDNALQLDPESADANAGKASAWLTQSLHDYLEPPARLLACAEQAAENGCALDPMSWRSHANLGTVHLFRHKWEAADHEFESAAKSNLADIGTIGGYGPYLLSRGRYDDARQLALQYLDEGFDDPVLLVRAGLYFYALREYDEAQDALQRALALDEYFWRAHLIIAFVFLAIGNADLALAHTVKIEFCAKPTLWPGFKIICLEACGRSDDAQSAFDALSEAKQDRYIQPMQLALANMALGHMDAGIACLEDACNESDPFTAWLHLWPLLDPMRRYPAFRALLRKWKFPNA